MECDDAPPTELEMKKENWWTRLTAEYRTEEEEDSSICVVYIERLFKIRYRNTSISQELRCGFYHFFTCCFILAVNSSLLQSGGYDPERVATATALVAGGTCILSGLVSNLPFVLSPATSTSLYFALFLRNRGLSPEDGNFAVFILGLLMFFCGIRPIALFISNIIPFVMKVGICLGVGLLVALNSMAEIGLVKRGDTTILDIGEFTPEIYIATVAFVTIGLALHYRIRWSFLLGLVVGTMLYYLVVLVQQGGHINGGLRWQDFVVSSDEFSFSLDLFTQHTASKGAVYRLVFDLYVIGVILLNGLAHGLAEMAGLKREDGTLPRGKWLYAACGAGTILSALLGAGPLMILPESAPVSEKERGGWALLPISYISLYLIFSGAEDLSDDSAAPNLLPYHIYSLIFYCRWFACFLPVYACMCD